MRRLMLSLAVMGSAAFLMGQGAPQATPAGGAAPAFWSWQETPAMGWNSWDCFGAGVNEEQTLANAMYMEKNLRSHGYNLITVDIQWYEPQAHTDQYRRGAVLEMDANGRLLPAGNRFPSTAEAKSFKPLADKVHAMGLTFGIHLMRGIPRQAVDRDNCPILGTNFKAADIADKVNVCRWNTDMYGVDMSKPGAQEYYDSVFALIASWEVDFVKVDDLSAPNYHEAEVTAIRKAIDKSGRKMALSTSPGETPLRSGEHVQNNANQWRISNDFWDTWPALKEQFARLNNWTPYRGPGHFPDADMLPVGAIRTWATRGAWTRFTQDEQVTLMTLWSIARSPLIIGGDMPKNDEFTLKILTNDEVLAVDQRSTNNKQVYRRDDLVAWVADEPGTANKYVALFNARLLPGEQARGRRGAATAPASAPATSQPVAATVAVTAEELGVQGKIAGIRDLWAHKDLEVKEQWVSAELMPHCSAMFKIAVAK